MRAAVFQGLHRPLVAETVADPTPGEGELVVRVGRCGICGSDLHMTEDAAYGIREGAVLGHEFAAEVIASLMAPSSSRSLSRCTASSCPA